MLIKKKREQHKDPEVELVARLLDRAESEGVVTSKSSELWSAPKMANGWLYEMIKTDEGWQGLAYKEVPDRDNGGTKPLNIDKAPIMPTREKAERALFRLMNAL